MNALGKPQWAPLGRIYVVKSDEKRRVNGQDFAPSGLNLLMPLIHGVTLGCLIGPRWGPTLPQSSWVE